MYSSFLFIAWEFYSTGYTGEIIQSKIKGLSVLSWKGFMFMTFTRKSKVTLQLTILSLGNDLREKTYVSTFSLDFISTRISAFCLFFAKETLTACKMNIKRNHLLDVYKLIQNWSKIAFEKDSQKLKLFFIKAKS